MQEKAKLLILMVCIILLAGIVAAIGVIGFNSANSDTNNSGPTEYILVASNSMEPAIHRGDVVKVDHNTNNIQLEI